MSGLHEAVLAEAAGWLGTPYQHQASVRGVGCDCLGLVRGIWRSLHGSEPQAIEPYRADWAEVSGEERMLDAARRWLIERPVEEARPGQVLLFRMTPDAVAKHCAILSRDGAMPRMIHAYWGRSVTESWMGDWWRRRLVACFDFPEGHG